MWQLKRQSEIVLRLIRTRPRPTRETSTRETKGKRRTNQLIGQRGPAARANRPAKTSAHICVTSGRPARSSSCNFARFCRPFDSRSSISLRSPRFSLFFLWNIQALDGWTTAIGWLPSWNWTGKGADRRIRRVRLEIGFFSSFESWNVFRAHSSLDLRGELEHCLCGTFLLIVSLVTPDKTRVNWDSFWAVN